MKPKKRARSYRAHHHLVGLFAVAAVFLIILNVAMVLAPTKKVRATLADNITGWAWSSTGGWLSMNSENVGAGGGSYGVHLDAVTKEITRFAWSNNMGWVCFGATCPLHAECMDNPAGNTPEGIPPYANVDESTGDLHGWAKFCNIPNDDGWIALNCSDLGACGTNVHVNLGTGQFSGWAWHGLQGELGWGWIDFSGVEMSGQSEDYDNDPNECADGIDNDFDGLIDCYDDGCMLRELQCPSVETNCGLISHLLCCRDGDDDDFDGDIDCDDADCATAPECIPEDQHVVAGNSCTDGSDNDLDGDFDCDDSDCTGKQGCEICTNLVDDDGDGDIDCDDADCIDKPECTPAWLQSRYGDVYSTLGVEGNPPPLGQTNATYCITSGGDIVNAESEEGCLESMEPDPILLPKGTGGYVSSLGRIDVAGILDGRYGTVEIITSETGIDSTLGGKIYIYESCLTPLVLNATTFLNAAGSTGQGSGLLVVKGCDLEIMDNISYEIGMATQYLRNLASFGILVLAQYDVNGDYLAGGNLTIDPGVENVVGTIYAEHSIYTGTTGDRFADLQLRVYGALVSREVVLERMYSSPTEAAEVITFDGRAVVNPPPGFQDVSKSLPSLGDTY